MVNERQKPEQRAEPTSAEPDTVSDGERPSVKSRTEARQGRPKGEVRWVLGISLALVIAGFAIVYYFFFGFG